MIDKFQGEHRFLSNFWPAPVLYEGKVYPTTEHAYQAAKTHNQAWREKIALTPTAKDAKRLGRIVKIREDWDKVRVLVMYQLVEQKFTVHPELKRLLLETGNQQLVEGNTWGDVFWGVCGGKGENRLGHILMSVRSKLKIMQGIQDAIDGKITNPFERK